MSQSITLYETEQHLAALADTEALVSEEQIAEFAAELSLATEQGLVKRDNCIRFIQHVKQQIAFSKSERTRLTKREEELSAGLERFESYVLGVVAKHGKRTSATIRRLEGRVGDLCAVDGFGSVEILDEAEVPMRFKRVTVRMHADDWLRLTNLIEPEHWPDVEVTFNSSSSAIKTALKAGETVPGATLVYSTGLQIK